MDQTQLKQLMKRFDLLVEENALLREQIRLLLHQKFGSKSEQVDPRQLELMMQLAELTGNKDPDENPPSPPPSPKKKARPSTPRLPENLPVEIETIIPDEVAQNPKAFKQIGEEVTEELDLVPQRYFIHRIVRPKYVDLRDATRPPLIGPLRSRPIEQGYASAGLLADIVIKKYRDHLPLYRQEKNLKSQDIDLSRQTMSDWMEKTSEWLKPIYNHIGNQLRAGPYLQVDETPIKYCGVAGGGSKQGYLWVYNDPGGNVLYEWHPSRKASCLEGMLGTFSGTLQCDGYSAYPKFARAHEEIELSACWAHARRKFFEAKEEAPKVAGWFLKQIGLLYQIESQLREKKSSPKLRQRTRDAQSRMIMERIKKALDRKLRGYLPQGGMGKAIQYTLKLWSGLSHYLENGLLEIDNNLVENAIRPTALGKKNWLFFGSPDSGQRSAIIYTILACCAREGVNPFDYLKDVLTRMPSMKSHEVESLTPAKWQAARRLKNQAADTKNVAA